MNIYSDHRQEKKKPERQPPYNSHRVHLIGLKLTY
jgi:hypothetical protein